MKCVSWIPQLITKKHEIIIDAWRKLSHIPFSHTRQVNKIQCFAKRFAAKEALFKAVGIKNKLQFKDVEIKNNVSGLPIFSITGLSLKNLKKLFKNKKFKIHLTLSDDQPWAVASVIIFTYK